jgi:hypothetical protein
MPAVHQLHAAYHCAVQYELMLLHDFVKKGRFHAEER